MESASGTMLKLKKAATAVKGQVQGLPHLQLNRCKGRLRAKLVRQWTMAKHQRQRDSVQCNVLPFMEISLAVQDTLDLVRSSVEEEIVFQATLQVPTHHAIACRIEAFGTPFQAPNLVSDVSQWSEDDHQFAACLASPPDVEEVPSFSFTRVASFVEQRAPPIKEGAAFATLSFSVRQRQNRQNSAGGDDDELPPADDLARTGSSSRSSLDLGRRRALDMQPAIAEEGSADVSALAAGLADPQQQQQQEQEQEQLEEADFSRGLSQLKTRSIARLQSFGPHGRTHHEVELALAPSSNGLASLLGVGFFVMQQWSEKLSQPGGPLGRNINTWTALLPPGGANGRLVLERREHEGRHPAVNMAPAVAASRVAPLA